MLIIERFEENTAVIEEDEKHFELDRKLLPENAREGDVLVRTDEGFIIDQQQTKQRREKIIKLQNSLWS